MAELVTWVVLTIIGALTNPATYVYLAKIAALAAIGKALLPDIPGPDLPTIGENQQFIQQPNSPRQITYGDAWVAPKIIMSRNTGWFLPNHENGDSPRNYCAWGAIADNPVQITRFHVDEAQFLSAQEMRYLENDCCLTLDPHVTPKVIEEVERKIPGTNEWHLVDEERTNFPEPKRQEANERYLEDENRGANRWTMVIVSRTRGNNLRPREVGKPWKELSAGDFMDRVRLHGLNVGQRGATRDTTLFPVNATNAQMANIYHEGDVPPPGQGGGLTLKDSFPSYLQAEMHCYGTAMMSFTFPIMWRKTKPALWPSRPNILLRTRRHRDSLNLWDDTLPGAPKIDAVWKYNNAALCLYDFLKTYTDYGTPIAGIDRLNAHSFARAAQICHDAGYYYAIPAEWDNRESYTDPDSTTIKRADWRANHALNMNGAFNGGQDCVEIVRQFMYCMAGGYVTETAGVLSVFAGERTNPTFGYDEDEIDPDSFSAVFSLPREKRLGLLDMIYFDSNGDSQHLAFDHFAAEENLQVAQIELVGVNSIAQARRVAFIENSRAWETKTYSFKLVPGTPKPAVNDMITLDYTRARVSGIFRVFSVIEDPSDGSVDLVVGSEREDLYNLPRADGQVVNYVPPPQPRVSVDNNNGIIVGLNSDGTPKLLEVRTDVLLTTVPDPTYVPPADPNP